MTAAPNVRQSVAVADPGFPAHVVKPNADGSINVNATVTATAESTAEATAAAPSYSEGQDAPLSQTLTGDLRVTAKQNGAWAITSTPSASATGTPTSVPSNLAAVTVLASNASRKGAAVYYDGAAILYLLAGAGTPSASLYTVKLGAGFFTYYETPANYTGVISGIWSVATGNALVTEYT